MNYKFTFASTIALLLVFVLPTSAQEAAFFTETDCTFPDYIYQFTCGFVTVPENHKVDNGDTIELAVAIIHTNHDNPGPDPVLYLAGGPGGAFVHQAPEMPTRFGLSVFLTHRDVIIVDQRGMGRSRPTFNCVSFTGVVDAFHLTIEQYQARMADCIPEYEAQGLDWQAFTTEQNAADMALVPGALGYDSYNFYGHSYGTMLGQIILRDYPENVRSGILDSVVALNGNSFETAAITASDTFDLAQHYCEADFLCNWAYPDLRETYIETYENLRDNPVTLTIQGIDFTVNERIFADIVGLNMADRNAISRLPSLIIAFAENDFEIVETFLGGIVARPVKDYPNQALLMTMICPYNAPYTSIEAIELAFQDLDEPFRVGAFNKNTLEICASWEGIEPADITLAESDIPTLVLGGELDGITPASWAETVAENLDNATYLYVPYTGHLTNSSTCVQGLTSTFIRNPESDLNTDCLQDIKPLHFVLHTTVTRPPVRIGAILLALVSLVAINLMLFSGLRDIRRTAWRMAFKRQGWLPLITLAVLALLIWNNDAILPDDLVSVGVVASIVPLFMGIQLAGIFSPADEPALELQIAAGRSMAWLLAERIVAVVITYSVIAFAGLGLSVMLHDASVDALFLIGWLPPALFLGGLGLYVSLRTRMTTFGMLIAGVLWFLFGLFAEFFIPGTLYQPPISYIQPFLWSIHVHASLDHLVESDYWLNRIFLSGAGISLMVAGIYNIMDIESLLLGVRSKNKMTKPEIKTVKHTRKSSMALADAVTTQINYLSQIAGIAKYSGLMQLRTRGIKVYAITPVVSFIGFILLVGNVTQLFGFGDLSTLEASQYQLIMGEMVTAFMASIYFVPALFLYPLLVAENMPKDESLHVGEILGGLPNPYWVTLAGRVLGVAGIGALVLIVIFIPPILVTMLVYGYFNLSPVFDLILGFTMAQFLLSALAILIGSTQSTARRAVGLVAALLILPEFVIAWPSLLQWFPAKAQAYQTYMTEAFFNTALRAEITQRSWTLFEPELLTFMSITTIHVLIAAAIAWGWHIYKNKQS